jgi:hypothetical protein
VGEALRPRSAEAVAAPAWGFVDFGGAWDASETTETVREISRAAQRTPFGAGQALPGPQKGHLRPGRERKRTFRDGRKAHRKTPRA